mmetsp:Transcript_11360/g.18257  ORF Transcript_11360/g.18257 Transcript_11360/m.18257 type:complete len:93 (-) Transcript_11360:86-364(-)
MVNEEVGANTLSEAKMHEIKLQTPLIAYRIQAMRNRVRWNKGICAERDFCSSSLCEYLICIFPDDPKNSAKIPKKTPIAVFIVRDMLDDTVR